MKRTLAFFACAALAGSLAAQQPPAAPKTHLKIGDEAPDFTLPATIDKTFKLSDFKGKKNVVVAFFPAAFTGGWTKEVTGYQAGIEKFGAAETQVIAISTDSLPTLSHWAGELKLEYPLASDKLGKVAQSYGVLNANNGFASRTTFVVDKEGKIVHIDEGGAAIDPTGALNACSRLKK